MPRGPKRAPGMNGEPSSVGTPIIAISASSRSRSVQIGERRNEGIPTNGRFTRPDDCCWLCCIGCSPFRPRACDSGGSGTSLTNSNYFPARLRAFDIPAVGAATCPATKAPRSARFATIRPRAMPRRMPGAMSRGHGDARAVACFQSVPRSDGQIEAPSPSPLHQLCPPIRPWGEGQEIEDIMSHITKAGRVPPPTAGSQAVRSQSPPQLVRVAAPDSRARRRISSSLAPSAGKKHSTLSSWSVMS